MKTAFLLLFLPIQTLFSQTVIHLHSPKNDRSDYTYRDLKDTALVAVEHSEDMGQWGAKSYFLRPGIGDGEYLIYVDDVLEIKAYMSNGMKQGEWIRYKDGKIICQEHFKDGLWDGEHTDYYPNGKLRRKAMYKMGQEEYSTHYYESGNTEATYKWNGITFDSEHFLDKKQ